MADISSYLKQILNAIYGEEVRGSIHDALAAMNEEAIEAMDIAARSKESALASANAAKESENNSALHEGSAQKAKETAEASEKAAKLSEENAAKSLTAAQASATSAQDSETTAKQLADAAKKSQESANQSALDSAASEKNAKTSESNAAESATKAKQEHDNYSQWVSEQEAAFLEWFAGLQAQFGDDAVGAINKQLSREEIARILQNGFAGGTKEISDDGTAILSTDADGRTLIKTFTDNFSKLTTELRDTKGTTVATLIKTFDPDGKSVTSNIIYPD